MRRRADPPGEADEARLRVRLGDPTERYRALIERVPAVIYLDRPDGSSEFVSPQVKAMTGIGEQEWLAGMSAWLNAVHPDDRERVGPAYLDPSARTASEVYRLVLPDGRIRWVHDQAVRLLDDQGRVDMWYGVIVDVTERIELEQALRESEQQRREVMAALVRREEQQRGQIAGELHDDTIQVMAAALLVIDQMTAALDRGELASAATAAERARSSLADAAERARRLTFELRPQVLEAQGLPAALRALTRRVAAEAGLRYSVRIVVDRQPYDLETLVYRTVAEGLSNVRRHSQASRVEVRVQVRDGAICGSVSDDGCGFDGASEQWQHGVSLHFGLQEAAERLRLAGGVLRVDSIVGDGTRLRFEVPLP